MRSILCVLLFTAALCLHLPVSVEASKQDDGVQAVLSGRADSRERAEALLELANRLEGSKPVESLFQTRSALAFAREGKDPAQIHKVLYALREMEFEHGTLEGALRSCIEALEVTREMNSTEHMVDDLHWLAKAYQRMGQHKRAVDECQRALYIAEYVNDTLMMAKAHLVLMEALAHTDRRSEAYDQGDLAEKAFRALGNDLELARTWLTIGEMHGMDGKPTDAWPYLVKAKRVIDDHRNTALSIRVNMDLVRTALQWGKVSEAERYITPLRELVNRSGERNVRIDLLDLEHEYALALGDPMKALDHLKAYQSAKDSMMDGMVAHQLAGLQALYDLNAKERTNSLLRDRNTANEAMIASEMQRNRTMLGVVILLSLMVLALALVGRTSLRSRRRLLLKNRVIRKQSEEINTKNLELQRQNMRLAESLISEEEKDLLLREIHHRVKNDLQIASTLLNLHMAEHGDSSAQHVLADTQRRIGTMAAVHDQLYKSSDLKNIKLRQHFQALSENVLRSFSAEKCVEVTVQCTVHTLPVETMIPLGLILNELVTNSVKHSVDRNTMGRISIGFEISSAGEYVFTYADGGPWPEMDRPFHSGSFGFKLVAALAEQLNGQVRILRSEGTVFELAFSGEEALRKAS